MKSPAREPSHVSTEPDEHARLCRQRTSGARTIARGVMLLVATSTLASLLIVFASGVLWSTIYAVLVAIGGGSLGIGHLVVGTIERRDAVRRLRGLVPEARLLRDR
jgi:hypothetical protein